MLYGCGGKGRGPLHIADINTIAGDDTSHGWGQLIRLTTLHSTVRTAVKSINYTQFQIVHFKQKFKIRGQLDTQCAAMFRVCCVNKHEILKYILNSLKTINTVYVNTNKNSVRVTFP